MNKIVKANLVENFESAQNPGDFWFVGPLMHAICPCGCGHVIGIKLFGDGAWKWDQNRECPTVSPSIRVLNGCCYHGFLVNGEFNFCEDSGHE